MADIRINALATTAASTASDDFVAVDGSANGTRKLNAYSPTFGGNLTVSGTGTTGGNLRVRNALGYATGIHTGTTSDSTQQLLLSSNAAYNHAYISKGSTTLGIGFSSDNGSFVADDSITITAATKLVTLAGNLTVSGRDLTLGSSESVIYFGTPSANYLYYSGSSLFLRVGSVDRITIPASTGNVLIGTTTDSSNGRLQLATHTTSAGGIGFGTDTSLYRSAAGQLRGPSSFIDATFASSGLFFGASMTLQANDNVLIKTNGSVTALTLDSSQNATFAGKITANGAGSTFKGTATNDNAATGYVGEFVSSAVVSASAVSLTNGTAANITSISLTAGDWDVTGLVQYNFTGATCSYVYHGFSSASAAFGAPNSYVQDYRNYTTASVSTHNPSLTFRISLAATTTIYFVTQADFSAGTVAAYGRIQARRVR